MSVNKVNKTTGETTIVAGSTLYADSPLGAILPYGGTVAPRGWLLCDGSVVSRTTYKDLFDVIGTAFGDGDGLTTFQLPNFKDRTPVGLNASGDTFNYIGKMVGEKAHTLTIDEIPSHGHNSKWINTSNGTVFAYSSHAALKSTNSGDQSFQGKGLATSAGLGPQTMDKNYVGYYLGIDGTGGGQAHNNIQPSLVTNFIIKAQKVSVPVDFTEGLESLAADTANECIDERSTNVVEAESDLLVTGGAVNTELEKDRQAIKENIETPSTMNAIPGIDICGDIPIRPLLQGQENYGQPNGLSFEDASDYYDGQAFGYVWFGGPEQYRNIMFNRIKVKIAQPGWVRIGIVRGTYLDQNDGVARGFARAGVEYDTTDVYPVSLIPNGDGTDTTADGQSHTMLKKWLVCQYASVCGLHEYDIPDEIITSPFEYLYIEYRTGVSGFAYNASGASVTSGDITIPNGYTANALAAPNKYVDVNYFGSGSWAMSNNMLDASALTAYTPDSRGDETKNAWQSVGTFKEEDLKFIDLNDEHYGNLQVGLYRRGPNSTIVSDPLCESCLNPSSTLPDAIKAGHAIYGWTPAFDAQQEIARQGREIYALDFFIHTDGDLTVYHMASTDPATNYVKDAQTLRIRGLGRQRVHLPNPIRLKPGEYICLGGATEAVFHTVNPDFAELGPTDSLGTGYIDTARFLFQSFTDPDTVCGLQPQNFTMFGDDPDALTDAFPYDAIIGGKPTPIKEFYFWSGVKVTGDEKKFDFTEAEWRTVSGYLNVGVVSRPRNRKISKVEDFRVSITGDSISTYRDVINKSTDFATRVNGSDNAVCYPNNGYGYVNSPDGTWWGKFIKDNRCALLRNDAWSGSMVSGTDSQTNSSACASWIRTRLLYNNVSNFTPNTEGTGKGHPYGNPDLILCMIGTNDLTQGVTVGAYSNTAPANISTILGAFEAMIAQHKAVYPAARLVYFLIPRGTTAPYPYTNGNGLSISQLASEFEYIAKAFGAYFVPLSYFIDLEYPVNGNPACNYIPNAGYAHPRMIATHISTTDRLHPTTMGHEIIADALTRFIEDNF